MSILRRSHATHLRQVSLFATCSDHELDRIAAASDDLELPAGHQLTREGATGREAFVIIDGAAVVSCNGTTIATLGPGDVVGELALLDRGPRTATVVAATRLRVLVIHQQQLAVVLDDVPAITHKLLVTLASRIRDLDQSCYGAVR